MRFDGRAKKPVQIDPPAGVAHFILARDGDHVLRSLSGVITTPTIRPDGNLLVEPGYDPTTRLLLVNRRCCRQFPSGLHRRTRCVRSTC